MTVDWTLGCDAPKDKPVLLWVKQVQGYPKWRTHPPHAVIAYWSAPDFLVRGGWFNGIDGTRIGNKFRVTHWSEINAPQEETR